MNIKKRGPNGDGPKTKKKMKKVFVLALLALVSVASYAQVSWNAKVGLNMSNMSALDDSKMKVGFNVGVGMEYAFTNVWSIQPSLMFTTKGTKFTVSDDTYGDSKVTINPMYLELPVLAAARFAVCDNQNIVVKAGPYFAYGVAGKNKYSYKGVEVSENVFGDGEDNLGMKRFDCGIAFGVDYEISKFFVGLNGEMGLTKLMDDLVDDNGNNKNPRTMNFYIGVGYKF